MKKNILIMALLVLLPVTVSAQTTYFITGSAVPEGEQPLVEFPDGQYKYAGTLHEGMVQLCTKTGAGTVRLLKPKYEDSYIVNHGIPYTIVSLTDSTAQWVVPFSENRYRFTIDTKARTVTGELFTPWDECFMVGGATECAWETYTFLPFTRDENELCVWTWVGELKYRSEHSEPDKFKIMGQNAWEPKSYHPYTNGEDIRQTTQIRYNNGTDYKWAVKKDGYYSVRIDVFHETCQAQYLGTELPSMPDASTDVQGLTSDAALRVDAGIVTATSSAEIGLQVVSLDGKKLFSEKGTSLRYALPHRGVYVLRMQTAQKTYSRKIVY